MMATSEKPGHLDTPEKLARTELQTDPGKLGTPTSSVQLFICGVSTHGVQRGGQLGWQIGIFMDGGI